MANPFASIGAPAANPFATVGATSNPFAAATTAAATTAAANPFAAVTATASAPGSNPFAMTTTTTTAAANPFAAVTGAASTAANPFAAATSAAASSNPFALTTTATTTTTAANPFAMAAPAAGAVPGAPGAPAGNTVVSQQLANDVRELQSVYVPNMSNLAAYKHFKHILYNLRDPNVDRYTKPPEMSQQEWDRAQKAAPEAYGSSDAGAGSDFRDDGLAGASRKRSRSVERLVPVAVIGWKGLKDRIDQQDRIIKQFTALATQLGVSLHEMELQAQQSATKIEQLRHKHTLLSQRLIRVMEMVDRVLARGMPLDRNEVKLRNRLENVCERLNRPTEFKARLNELIALQRMHGERRRARASFTAGDLRALLDRLKAQRLGLAHLTRIVRRDARDIGIMLRPHKALDMASAAEAMRQQRSARAAAASRSSLW